MIFNLGLRLLQIVVDRLDHRRSEFLRRKPVASPNHAWSSFQLAVAQFHSFVQSVHYVEVQRFADRARFFGAIENGNLANGGGEGLHKRLHAERAIQADFEHADLLTVRIEVVDGLVRDLRAGSHDHDDALGIGRTDVIE